MRLGLALVLATALWLYVTGKQDPVQSFDYPFPLTIGSQNIRDGLTITNNLPTVRVRVQANRQNTPVTQTSFHTFVDLTGIGKGFHYAKVKVLPDPGIQVLQVTPPMVGVALDTIKEKHVPVHYKSLSKPASGYNVAVLFNPDTVVVSGPESVVSQVSQALVYLDLAGLTSSTNGVYSVSPANTQKFTVPSRLLSLQPGQVRVNVRVSSPSRVKTVPVIPAVTGQPNSNLAVTNVVSKPSNVTIYGSPGQISSISSVLTKHISVSRRGAGTFVKHVKLILPSGVNANTHRIAASVTIGIPAATSSTEATVAALDLTPGLSAHVQPSSVVATIVGSSEGAGSGGVAASVNLRGLGAGTYRLRPLVAVPPGERLAGVYPSEVTVIVKSRAGR